MTPITKWLLDPPPLTVSETTRRRLAVQAKQRVDEGNAQRGYRFSPAPEIVRILRQDEVADAVAQAQARGDVVVGPVSHTPA